MGEKLFRRAGVVASARDDMLNVRSIGSRHVSAQVGCRSGLVRVSLRNKTSRHVF